MSETHKVRLPFVPERVWEIAHAEYEDLKRQGLILEEDLIEYTKTEAKKAETKVEEVTHHQEASPESPEENMAEADTDVAEAPEGKE